MDAHEAIKIAVDGHHEEIAKAVGRSANLVYRWTLPSTDFSDSGAYSDLDRLEALMEKSLALGTEQGRALAPIYRLAQRFGGVFLPPAPKTSKLRDISHQMTVAMKTIGETLAATADAIEDDTVTPAERKEILRKAQNGMHHFALLVRMVESGEEG